MKSPLYPLWKFGGFLPLCSGVLNFHGDGSGDGLFLTTVLDTRWIKQLLKMFPLVFSPVFIPTPGEVCCCQLPSLPRVLPRTPAPSGPRGPATGRGQASCACEVGLCPHSGISIPAFRILYLLFPFGFSLILWFMYAILVGFSELFLIRSCNDMVLIMKNKQV